MRIELYLWFSRNASWGSRISIELPSGFSPLHTGLLGKLIFKGFFLSLTEVKTKKLIIVRMANIC